MVAVFSGTGLGYFNSSLTQIGGSLTGASGRDQHGVNAANGNLVLQALDENLLSRGLAMVANRTYNSQGTQAGPDGWMTGFEKRVEQAGGAGTNVTLYESDGSVVTFAWFSSETYGDVYRSTVGDGAHDTLTWDGTYWLRDEGTTRRREYYLGTAASARLHQVRETRGDAGDLVRYAVMYDGSNRVAEVRYNRTADTGTGNDAILFGYNATTGLLESVSTRESGKFRQQVTYGYDGSNRLAWVQHDLSPELDLTYNAAQTDNTWSGTPSANDGQRYRTEYTYVGATLRIASVKSSDGRLSSYTYDGSGRVLTVTRGDVNTNDADAAGGETTTFAYDTVARRTDVTDTLGRTWSYFYDANNQLTAQHGPARDGQRDVTTYGYNAAGDVTLVETTRGATLVARTVYAFDTSGNLLQERDALGNTIDYTYTTQNQLATRTLYAVPDPDGAGAATAGGAMTTHYFYDTTNRLRFTVGPLGEVAENRYGTSGNSAGLVTETRRYLANAFSPLPPTYDAVVTWVSTQATHGSLTSYTYDAHGRLSKRRDIGNMNGTSIAANSATTDVDYVYDAQGLLRTQISRHGADHLAAGAATNAATEVVDYVYDGIGRLLDVIKRGANTTFVNGTDDPATLSDTATLVDRTSYLDSAMQIRVVTDAGATRVETRNGEGRLLQVSEAATGITTRNTYHFYDAAGQLRLTQDAGGGRTFFFYDERGNLAGTVDPTGLVVEKEFDSLGRVVRTITHAERVSTTTWATGTVPNLVLALPAKGSSPNGWGEDFDDASIAAALDMTDVNNAAYTSLQRVGGRLVLQPTANATTIFPKVLSTAYSTQTGPLFRMDVTTGATLANSYAFIGLWNGSTTMSKQVGLSFAGSALTAYETDTGSTSLLTLAAATTYTIELHATSEGIDLRVYVKGQDSSTAVVFHHDTDPSLWSTAQLNIQSMMGPGASGAPVYVDNLAHQRVRVATANYDQAGRLVRDYDGGATTTYEYDGADRLVRTIRAAPGETARVERRFYDASSRLIGVLDALGFLTEHQYDAGGRLAYTRRYANAAAAIHHAAGSFTDLKGSITLVAAQDQVTRFLVDRLDRIVGVLDAEGYLTENVYDEAGNARITRRYAKKGSPGSTAALTSLIASATPAPPAELYRETRRQFNHLGQLATEINHEGTVTRHTYDEAGRLVRSEVAADTTEVRDNHLWADAFGQLIGEMTPANVAAAVAAAGGTPLQSMSEAQKLTAFTNFGTRHAYDVLGRRIESIDAEGHKTWAIYDAAGRNTFTIRGLQNGATRNARGLVTETRYSAFGEVAETLTYNGQLTIGSPYGHAQAWTAVNTLAYVASIDSRRQYLYDSRGLLVQQSDATGGVSLMRYNRFGELTSTTTGAGSAAASTSQRTYDRRGLLETQTDAVGTPLQRIATRTYDAFGRVATATDARGNTTTFAYDRLGRVLTTSLPSYTGISGAARTEVVAATYDAFGQVLTQVNAVGQTTTFKYSDVERSVEVITADLLSVKTLRNRHGETVTIRNGFGDEKTFEYDASGRQTKATNEVLDYTTFEYDVRGNLKFSLDGNGVGNKVLYSYDAIGRVLTREEDADGLSLVTSYDYTVANQVTVTEPGGKITRTNVDLEGRTILVTRDPSGLNLRTKFEYDAVGRQVKVTEGEGSTAARETVSVYDALGRRVSESVDPTGLNLTTQWIYDAGDNVVGRNDPSGVGHGYVYDQANRLVYTLDTLHGPGDATPTVAVTRHWYDEAGRLVGTRRYANALTLTEPQVASLLSANGNGMLATMDGLMAPLRDDARDEMTHVVNDAAGKLRFLLRQTAAGKFLVEETRYDARGVGNHTLSFPTVVSMTVAEGNNLLLQGNVTAATAQTRLDTLATLVGNTGGTAVESYRVVNGAGRERFVVVRNDAGLGVVTEKRYDNDGNVVTTIRHALAIAFDPADNASSVNTKLAGETADQQLVTQYAYDKLGRLRFTVSETNHVVEQRYDDLNRLTETRQYMQPVTFTGYTEAALAAGVASHVDVRKTTHAYDKAGRLSTTTDAANKVETWTYDAVGNRLTYKNKLDATWDYVYDKGGRLLEEKSPPVRVFRHTAVTHDAVTDGGVDVRIVTRMGYDALGNVTSRTENFGAAEARTTTYDYDSRGNQIRTTFPDAWQIDETSLQLVASGTQPTVEVTYDTLGRAVVEKNVRGHYSYKVYDALGQVSYDVDAEGYVTSYGYDHQGRQTTLTRHGTALAANVPTGRDTGQVMTHATWKAKVDLLTAGNRVLTTTYDRLGLKKTVVQTTTDAVQPVYYNSAGVAQTASPTTEYLYDAFGQLTRESVRIDDATWARTRHWYDQLGRRTMSVDAEGYVTTWDYDAAGAVRTSIEWARKLDQAAMNALNATPTPAAPTIPTNVDATTGPNRVVDFTYDALGRKLIELTTRSFQTQGGATSNPMPHWKAFGYDAEGRVTTVDDAGRITTTNYDVLGRTTGITEHARDVLKADRIAGDDAWSDLLRINSGNDLADAALYESVSPYTEIAYDAFGNAVRTIRYAKGKLGAATTAQLDTNNDQTSYVRYDRQGRAVASVDAVGHKVYQRYNAADLVTVSFYDLSNGVGAATRVKDLYSWDRLGRQVEHYECRVLGGVDTADGAEAARYNAFGELVAKAWIFPDLGTAAKTVDYVYDAAGNMISNDETGAVRQFRYDLAGRQVAEIRGAATTRMVRDALGRATTTVLPSHTSDALLTTTLVRVYDRWGNVVSETDPRGYTTTRTYNDRNQLLTQTGPMVSVIDASHNAVNVQPVTRWFYGAFGELVAVQDAHGNFDNNYYNAAGQLVRSEDALGYWTLYGYDALGRQLVQEDALGWQSTKTYDKRDRVLTIGDFRLNGGVRTPGTRETYTLNGNGDRITVANALGQTARFNYDPRGLLLRSQSAAGVVMSYGYDWSGNKKSETYGEGAGSRTQAWDYDIHNRLVDHKDLNRDRNGDGIDDAAAGHDYNYTYDANGRLSTETSDSMNVYAEGSTDQYKLNAGLTRTTTYYTNGLVRKIDYGNGEYTEYEYDANGNRTLEKTVKPAIAGDDAAHIPAMQGVNTETRITYDSHNRVVQVTTDDLNYTDNRVIVGNKRVLTVSYQYDAMGNRRYVYIASGYGAGAMSQTDAWYTYDKENRTLVEAGRKVGSDILVNEYNPETPEHLTKATGSNTYDAVGRLVARATPTIMLYGPPVYHVESNVYDQRGQRIVTTMYGDMYAGYERHHEVLTYDDAGRLTKTVGFFGPDDYFGGKNLNGIVKNGKLITYDADGRVTTQVTWGRSATSISNQNAWITALGTTPGAQHYSWSETNNATGLTKLEQTSYRTGDRVNNVNTFGAIGSGYDALGRLEQYDYQRFAATWERTVMESSDFTTYVHFFDTKFVARDQFLEARVDGKSDNSNYGASWTKSWYDAAGRRHYVVDYTVVKGSNNNLHNRRRFAFNGDGQVLFRADEYMGPSKWEQGQAETGPNLGNKWGWGGMTDAEWNSSQFGRTGREAWYDKEDNLRATYANGQQIASFNEGGFDVKIFGNLTGFSSSKIGAGRIVVQEGDNLRALANRAYGTESLWYVIADANGLSADSVLAGGTTLNLPEVRTNTNDTSTYKPYDPSEMTGATSPAMPYMPSPDAGCGTVGMIIAAIVIVIVAIYAPPVAVALANSIGGAAITAGVFAGATVGSAMVASGVVAVAASAVVRGIASAAGLASFSWKDVAVDGLTAAFSAGIAQGLNVAAAGAAEAGKASLVATAGGRINSFGRVLQGVGNYAGGVVANAAVGRDTNFSWKGVAATVIGSYVGGKVGGRLPGADGDLGQRFLNDLGEGVIGGAINASARRLMGLGKQRWGQIAADAFSNAAGNAVVNMVQMAAADRRAREEQSAASAPGGSTATVASGSFVPTDETLADWSRLLADEELAAAIAQFEPSGSEGGDSGSHAGSIGAAAGASRRGTSPNEEQRAQLDAMIAYERRQANYSYLSDSQVLDVAYARRHEANPWEYLPTLDPVYAVADPLPAEVWRAFGNLDRGVGFGVYSLETQRAWQERGGVRPEPRASGSPGWSRQADMLEAVHVLQAGVQQYRASNQSAIMNSSNWFEAGIATTNWAVNELLTVPVEGALGTAELALNPASREALVDTVHSEAKLFSALGPAYVAMRGTQWWQNTSRHEMLRGVGGGLVTGGPGLARLLTPGVPRLKLGSYGTLGVPNSARWLPQGLTEAQFESMSLQIRAKAGSLGLGDNIFVHGSRGAASARRTSDIDVAIRVSPEEFDRFMNETSALRRVNPGSSKAETRLRAIESGKIQRGEARFSSLGRQLEHQLGMEVDISVIRIGGEFDNGPFIPLWRP